jgi:CheY-like chemotaxis protein
MRMDDVQVLEATCGSTIVEALRQGPADCLVLGSGADHIDADQLAKELQNLPVVCPLPVIIYGNGRPERTHDHRWRSLKEMCTLRHIHSPERLVDLTTYFLHRGVSNLNQRARAILDDLYCSNKVLARKKVLIVDDDMRNIFALSTVLEEHEMEIVSAGNGRDAIELLSREPQVDIVLMDIMMPDMDGYVTMREIRKVPTLKNLPIIAVTAKAMKGDREKCIEAGAWDYLAKPVDPQQMLGVLRGWLHR